MLKYKELIKHPVPPVEPEYIRIAKQIADERWWIAYLYHAEVIEGVLALTLYQWDRCERRLITDMRHFFDGERWVMQRISDNKKLTCSMPYYTQGGRRIAVDGADEVISSYFGDSQGKGLQLVFDNENKVLKERLNARHKKELDIIDARMAIVAENPPAAFFDWLENTALAHARYYFYEYRKGKKQTGYCSHCKTTFSAAARNGGVVRCPSCGSELLCRSRGKISCYGIYDRVYVTYMEETAENGKPILVERCFGVQQDICHAENGAALMHKTVICSEFGRAFYDADDLQLKNDGLGCSIYSYGFYKQSGKQRWCNANGYLYRGGQLIFPGNLDGILKKCSIPILRNVELSVVAAKLKGKFSDFIDILAEYPFIENLAKQGANKLLHALFDGDAWDDALTKCLHSEFTACEKALGISKDAFRQFVERDISPKEYLLYVYAAKPAIPVFDRLLKLGLESNHRTVGSVVKHYGVSAERMANYIEKQSNLLNGNPQVILNLYRDYLSMAEDLRLPWTESVMFPKNLRKEHDRLIPLKAEYDRTEQEKLLKKRVKILEMLYYTDEKFLIRPLRSTEEFMKESSVLNHCVKTYIKRCAYGETNIYGIRKVSDLEKPYFTLTLSNEVKVTMNLGKNNCEPPKEVKDFVKKWLKTVVRKKKMKFIEAVNPPKDK